MRRYQFYDAVQSWLVLLVVGFCIGLVAASLDIASDWSNDVKFGICTRGFWIPRHMYRLHTSTSAPFNNKNYNRRRLTKITTTIA